MTKIYVFPLLILDQDVSQRPSQHRTPEIKRNNKCTGAHFLAKIINKVRVRIGCKWIIGTEEDSLVNDKIVKKASFLPQQNQIT